MHMAALCLSARNQIVSPDPSYIPSYWSPSKYSAIPRLPLQRVYPYRYHDLAQFRYCCWGLWQLLFLNLTLFYNCRRLTAPDNSANNVCARLKFSKGGLLPRCVVRYMAMLPTLPFVPMFVAVLHYHCHSVIDMLLPDLNQKQMNVLMDRYSYS